MFSIDSSAILLPDGRTVDFNTTEGADAYIMCNKKNFVSRIVREVNVARSRQVGGNLFLVEATVLYQIYSQLGISSQAASDDVFALIPESELECWFDHFMQLLVTWTTNDTWRSTGEINPFDHVLFIVTTGMLRHKSTIAVARDKDFLRVLADFLEARSDSGLPHFKIAQHVCNMLNSMTCFHLHHKNLKKVVTKETWASAKKKEAADREKIMRKLESSGILCQFLRCSTLLSSDECVKQDCLIFDEILLCPRLLKRNFVKGSICGDTVLAILDGTSYACANEKILEYMRSIARLAKEYGKSKADARCIPNCYFCENVIKAGLKQCSRCKLATYCGKECQKAHWKKHHKLYCVPFDEKDAHLLRNDLFNKHAAGFLDKNYVQIAKKMIEILKTKNCKRYEIIIRLDYYIGKNGSLLPPALREPPEFKVSLYRSCFEDSRRDRWCDDKNCKMLQGYMESSLQNQDNRDRLYIFVRTGDAKVRIHSVVGAILNGPHNRYSEDTLEAVRLVVEEENYVPLFKCFGDHYQSLSNMLLLLNDIPEPSDRFCRAMARCPAVAVVIKDILDTLGTTLDQVSKLDSF